MSFRFVHSDAGRSTSKRPKAKNDCTVRAIALAANLPYDVAYDLISAAGRKSGARIDFRTFLKANPVINGFRFVWESYPAVKGQRRMNPVRFSREKNDGIYICKTGHHVYVAKYGVVYDDHQTYDERCIYGAWKVVREMP